MKLISTVWNFILVWSEAIAAYRAAQTNRFCALF
jgi:hypothetical protein